MNSRSFPIHTTCQDIPTGIAVSYSDRLPLKLLLELGKVASDRPRFVSRKVITPVTGMASGITVTCDGAVPLSLVNALAETVDDLDTSLDRRIIEIIDGLNRSRLD